ncbi:hypothetical protein N0V82_000956 [Gnomoniopsis sp. IMI 355080]|nr:hypothetical protein N0V82_000956 [Gnomoniopsis sp. IMI 355080]
MAPVNTSGVAVNGSGGVASSGNKRVSSVPKPYVRPVIPLPYMQRRPKTVKTDVQPSSPLRTNNETAPPTPKQNNHELPKSQPQPQPQPQVKSPKLDAAEARTNGHKPVEEAPAVPHRSSELDTVATTTEADDAPFSQESRPVTAGTGTQTQGTPTQSQTTGQTSPPDTVPSAAPSVSFPPPTLSPPPFHNNTNNMGPPHHPANFRGPVPDPIRLPSHPLHQQRMHHQQHPSNGSMRFGYHGSNASSPIPHPGGAFPVPPVPMPMPHEQVPIAGVDSFGRPILATAPINGQPPVAMNHGPLTPHSFHGSQSSRDAAEIANRQMINGNNGVDLGRPGPPPGITHPSQNSNNQPQFDPSGFQAGEAMDFADYISSMFARPEFADCEVVLEIPNYLTSINSSYSVGEPAGPLRLPAHQLVLSHHPLLRRTIQEQAGQGDGSREIRIISDDPFLRADSMWRAIKYLYGFRYVPLPLEIQKQSSVEKFHFILGYAAAGAHLEVPHISITAMREAIEYLSWDTVEKGVEFAMGGLEFHDRPMHVPHTFPQFRYRHGTYVGELVDRTMVFLATNFPSNFVLDTNVEEPRYSRLPVCLPGHGISSQNSKNGHGPSRTSSINIRFGDMEPNETSHGQFQPGQTSGSHLAALSRLLINLPYEVLKLVLESNGLGGVAAWRTVQDRRRAMTAIVAEREARREHLIRELAAGRHDFHVPVDGLRSKEPCLLPGNWSNVCWKEECVPNPDGPVMNRVWIPLGDAY